MKQPVTYKFIMDNKGLLLGIELWQAGQFITLSMEGKGTHANGYRWSEIKEFMDNIKLPSYSDPENTDVQEAITKAWTKPQPQVKEKNNGGN